jgi:hypothetical protein
MGGVVDHIDPGAVTHVIDNITRLPAGIDILGGNGDALAVTRSQDQVRKEEASG